MLERMRRETSQQYIVDLIAKIRAGVPGIALRTTFIVGFPGETEASFQTLLDFIRETKFERLGVFAYSQGGRHARRRDERANPRQSEAKAPRTGHGRAAQSRRGRFPNPLLAATLKVLGRRRRGCETIAKRERQFVGTRLDPRDRKHTRQLKGKYSRRPRRGGCAGH
jgi:hypothetical protein